MEDRLQKFATLVDLGSFTKAANTLHLSQPALSASINKLERELKQPLIVHGVRPLKLTQAGEYAYFTAKELNVATSNLNFKLSLLKNQTPHVVIGMVDSIAHSVFGFPKAIDKLQQEAKLSLVVNNSRYLIESLQNNTIDIAFVVEPKKKVQNANPSLKYLYVGSEPMVITCHKDIYMEAMESVKKNRLSPFISYDMPSNTNNLIVEALSKSGVTLGPTMYSTSPEVNLQLVVAKKGISVLPFLAAKALIKNGTLKTIKIGKSSIIERRICAVTNRGKDLPGSIEEFSTQVSKTLTGVMEEAVEIDNQTP